MRHLTRTACAATKRAKTILLIICGLLALNAPALASITINEDSATRLDITVIWGATQGFTGIANGPNSHVHLEEIDWGPFVSIEGTYPPFDPSSDRTIDFFFNFNDPGRTFAAATLTVYPVPIAHGPDATY